MNHSQQVEAAGSSCNYARIDRFLTSDHYRIEDDDPELMTHLNVCLACREYMESQAADIQTWNEAKTLLRPSEFDNSSSADYSAAGSLGRSSEHPVLVQDVLDSLAPTDDPHRLGRIGTYEISGVVGVGGMGVVLKGIDPALDRVVAIKVMAPRLANNEAARRRFSREAKAAAAVLHPNVIPIYGVSSDTSIPYLVMAYIRGGSLQKRLAREGPLPLVEILRISSQIAAGLAAAHEQGLVHRDIKPENILLEEGVERVTITDFGLARAVDDNTVTQNGSIVGTPMYMSPEQARGEQVDQKSDLFSLGSVMYALCTGRPPYQADSSYGVMRQIIDESPTPIQKLNPEIPEWLARLVERLMSREKTGRFGSASEVHKLLEGCLSHVQQPEAISLPAIPGITARSGTVSFLKTRRGILSLLAVASVALLMTASRMLPGVNRSTAGVPAPTQPEAKPYLIVEKHESDDSDSSVSIHRWKLKGNSVGKVVIRVLHIENGKARVQGESVIENESGKEGTIEVELHLINSGEPLPFAGKVIIPTLAVSMAGLHARPQAAEKVILPSALTNVSFASQGRLQQHSQILMRGASKKADVEDQPTLESLIDASRKGGDFLVTTVDWESVAHEHVNPVEAKQRSAELGR